MALRLLSSLALLGAQLRLAVAQDSSPGGPVNDGQPANCNAWHTIVDGDDCKTVPEQFGITFEQFLEWNPAVSEDCLENFWLGNAYCVGVSDATATSTTATSTTAASTTAKSTTSKPASSTITPGQPSSLSSGSATITSNSTYSVRVPTSTWNLTVPVAETTWPPKATQTGQPSDCIQWHLVGAGETCANVLNRYRFITSDQLHAWNPELHDDCSGLYADYWICVGTQSAKTTGDLVWSTATPNFTMPTTTIFTETTIASINSTFIPEPSQGPMPDNCQNYYMASANDTCQTILDTFDYITKEQFFEWNPVLDGDCNGLWANNYYCVGAFDSGAQPNPGVVTTTPSPTPSGSPTDCVSWYQTTIDDSCDDLALIFGTFDADTFISWNPSVDTDCSAIQQDTWYCVAKSDTPTTRTDGGATATSTGDSMPTQTGISAACTDYWFVSSTDTCASIASRKGISESTIIELNPALGSSCSGLTSNYYICVGSSNSTSTITTATNTAQSSTAQSTTTTDKPTTTTSAGGAVVTPTPVRDGMATSCRRFYLMHSGELCYDMAQNAGITSDEFIEWNPAVGDDCSNLWPDYYYCVGISGTATTFTSAPATTTSAPATATSAVATPSPVRDGMATSCRRFYLMHSGELCYDMAQNAGITSDEFIEWNPAVGDDCSNLWPDYYYCVGVSGTATTFTSAPATATATATT